MRRYVPNYGEQERGIASVVLPLGSVDAIDRLARDMIAFGYGMGGAPRESGEAQRWHEKAWAAHRALMENVRALAGSGVPSSVVPAVDPSRSTPLTRGDT